MLMIVFQVIIHCSNIYISLQWSLYYYEQCIKKHDYDLLWFILTENYDF